ncbi:MAG TPA: MFS transporter [Dehalococcoidia bacterium]|nr:MFS transporter [Dehalococcoidia bacterium]
MDIRPRFFYGWVIIAAAFVPNLVYPAVHFSFGTYFESLTREFGVDRGTVSLVFSLTPLLYFGLGAITGPLTDRFGPRVLCGVGAVLYLAGLTLASRATAIWQVYLTYSLFVGAAVGASYVPSLSTVQRWFVRRRALAAGLVASGSGVGTVVGPAFSIWLIQEHGWRTAYFVSGLVAAALVGLAAWFLIRSPADLGQAPDGGPVGTERTPAARRAAADLTVREAIRTRPFIWLFIAQGFTTLPLYIGLVHLVPFARDAGLDPDTAALGLAAIGAGSTVGRLGLGSFADRWGRRRSYALTMVATAVMMAVWIVLPVTQVWALLLFGFAFGTAYGGFVALSAVVMPDYFGTSYVSGLIGVFYTAAGIGGLIGPWLAGGVFDRTGYYQPAILFGAATATIGAVLVARLPDPAQAQARYVRSRA